MTSPCKHRWWIPWSVSVTIALGILPQGWAADRTDPLREQIGVRNGLCVLLGNVTDQQVAELARQTNLLIYRQLATAEQTHAARRAADAAGLGATRIQIDQGDLSRLHLADNLADVVVVAGKPDVTPRSELLRVLQPGGKAVLEGKPLIKPVPAGVDDWSHPYHGPDNNPLSGDTRIVAPYLTQFLADPRYGPAPQVAVAAGGRVFKIFGNVAWHEREALYMSTVVAFNGYNGTVLWKYALPKSMMVHRNVFIATPQTLYLGDDKSCKLIDAKSGKVRDEIRPPIDMAGGTFWKWMALQGNVLYALIGEQEERDEPKRWKRTQHGWPWNQISRGFNVPKQPWGYGRNLLAIDVRTKKVLWHYHEQEPIDARAVCMSSDRLFAFQFGRFLTCLDNRSGRVLWRKSKEQDPELFAELGTYLPRQGWQTNWRTAAYLKCTDEALYFAGPQMSKLIVLSAGDGHILWQDPYDNYQLILRPEAVYGISGPWGNNVSKKFDPLSGNVLAELPTGRRACTRPTATIDSILYRAMGGSVRFDVVSNQPRWISPMRPACHDGVTIANGMLYWWPYACDCQLSLYGVTGLGPAGNFNFTPDWRAADRLEKSPAIAEVQPLTSSPADWPTFRANNRGSATTSATIPAGLRLLWQTKLDGSAGNRPTAPVTVGELVFVAGSDGAVRALDGKTGQQRWKSYTGGEMRLPPTIWKGRALAGSGDGWLYAFEATTGRRLWRFRAAPAERKIPVYGKLLSTWPVGSGVLVQDDTAYFAAGIANYDGTYVYALDPNTGYVKWCNDTSGHLDRAARVGVSVQGHLLSNAGKLYLAGGNAVSPAVYDRRDGRCLNDPAPLAKCESTSPRGWELFLIGDRVISCGMPFYSRPDLPVYDHTVTKKMFHTSLGDRDIVWLDNNRLLCVPHIDRDALNGCVSDEKIPRHITQAWGQFNVKTKPLWAYNCAGSVAIAVAGNAVVVADDSHVTAVAMSNGKRLWSQELPAAPVPWGLAVDRAGRVILALTNNQLVCFGQ